MGSFLQLRRSAGLSIDEVAELLGLSSDTVSAYDTGTLLPRPREIQILKGLAFSRTVEHFENSENESSKSISVCANSVLSGAAEKIGNDSLQIVNASVAPLVRKIKRGECSSMLLKYNPRARPQDSARERLLDQYAGRISVNEALTRSLVSFQGNKKQPFVGWMKYKEAFSSEFVRFVFDSVQLSNGRLPILFDPFAGSGTALFVAAERGWNASGTELLPVGNAVVSARIAARHVNTKRLANLIANLNKTFSNFGREDGFPHLKITQGAFPNTTERDIASYRAFVSEIDDSNLKTLMNFAALCVLEDVSFTRKDGQYLRWDKRSGRKVTSILHKGDVPRFRKAIKQKLEQILFDIESHEQNRAAAGDIRVVEDSFLSHAFQVKNDSVDLVITSPPYCNRYDYTRTYALELAYLGFNEQSIRDLRQSLLSATVENRPKVDALSKLFAEHKQPSCFETVMEIFQSNAALQEVLSILEAAGQDGHLNNPNIPRMVRNYFFEMAIAISHLSRIVRSGGLVVMVNDNVRYFGEEVPVDLVLGSFAESLGFDVEKIWVLPRGKGNSSQQMGVHGRSELRKCVYLWRKT